MNKYYTEYPYGEFSAQDDEAALKISDAEIIYKESDTVDGLPLVMLRDKRKTAK